MALASSTALSWHPLPHPPPAACVQSLRISRANVCPSVSPVCGWREFSIPLRFSLRNSVQSPFLDLRLSCSSWNLGVWKKRRQRRRGGCGVVTARAGMRLDPGGGNGNGDGGIGRVIANLVVAGGLTYLTLNGQLGWIIDTILSLWLLAVIVPIVGLAVFLWFADREMLRDADCFGGTCAQCPNCGQFFQVLKFTTQKEPNLCPYCSQPFKLDRNQQFVRDEPRFSSENSGGFKDGFGQPGGFGRGASRPEKQDPGGIIVDVEATVVDRDG